MNKHIKELAKQADIHIDKYGLAVDDEGVDIEKFAQLIIKECAKVADDNFNSGFCPVGGFIQEHFGISSTKKSSEDNNDRG